MRDGNEKKSFCCRYGVQSVLEVTMRDGNRQMLYHHALLYILVLEVTMRDGNPFQKISRTRSYNRFSFRSDYEGWKPKNTSFSKEFFRTML